MKHYIDIENIREEDIELMNGMTRESNCKGFEPGDHITITTKIDGTNGSIEYNPESNSLIAYSRKNELNAMNTNQGFWNYVQTLNPEDFKDEETGQDEDDDYADPPREGLREDPYPIDSDQFANEHRFSYDKVTLYIYKDDVVVDAQGKTVDDIEQCLGKENLPLMEELADEDGVVLIRNEMRSTDYEVYLMDETYIPEMGPPIKEDYM